ncbi:MAG: YkvA family protein [Pseudomonadota bacterium]
MTMRITFELTSEDLDHFREVMQRARTAAHETDADKIIEAANKLLSEVEDARAPEFVVERLNKLRVLIDMVQDQGWALPDEDQERVLSALAYFSDPEDLIPDEIPGLGFLDDAIMVELVVRELKPEIEAYADFCKYRTVEANRRNLTGDELDRAEWLVERRKQLQSRMRNRRNRRRRPSSRSGRSPFSLF